MTTFAALSNRAVVGAAYDLKVLATRFASHGVPRGFLHAPELAPSRQLWADTQELKRAGTWNRDAFRTAYAPRFIAEMRASADARRRLIQLRNLSESGARILVVCYCKDPTLCHRSLLYLVLRGETAYALH